MAPADPASHVAAIIALAEEIAQAAPECADKALRIIEAARELGERNEIEEKTLRVTNLLLEGLIKVRNEK